jgi:hypothetical protein
MLEILALIFLCNKNKENALARGRRPGGFIALTIVLWFGLEFSGAFIGGYKGFGMVGIYLLAICCAVVGGGISYLAAKYGKPGNYAPPAAGTAERAIPGPEPLAQPLSGNPMRAVWTSLGLIAAWLVFLLLSDTGIAGVLSNILLGAGAYMLLLRGPRFKLFAAVLLVLEAFTVTFNQTATVAAAQQSGSLRGFFDYYTFWPAFGYAFISIAVVAGLTLLFSYIWRDAAEKRRVYGSGWIAAAGVLLYGVVRILINFMPYLSDGTLPPALLWPNILGIIISVSVLGLSVMLFSGICVGRKTRGLKLSRWAKVWCSLCIAAMGLSLLVGLFGESLNLRTILFLPVLITGFILLLCGKRSGFFVVLTAGSVYLIGTFQSSLTLVLSGSDNYLSSLLLSVVGAANRSSPGFPSEKRGRPTDYRPRQAPGRFGRRVPASTCSPRSPLLSILSSARFL